MAAHNGPNSALDPRLLAPLLSEQERAIRDAFVAEYMKSFDHVQACVAIGFQLAFAQEFGPRFMSEPYVVRRIEELERTAHVDEEEQAKQDKALVMNVLREAAQRGTFDTRVRAASKLATILGMDDDEGGEEGEQTLINAMREFASKVPV